MWTKPGSTTTVLNRSASTWQAINTLNVGQIFSLNEKSKRLAFVKIMADDQVVACPVTPAGPGPEMTMTAPVDMGVMVHEPEAAPVNPIAREYCLYDRIRLRDSDVTGTIIDINKSKFPDVDLIVLWDQIMHGSIMSEIHPHEIECLNQKAEGKAYDLARESREFLKNVQDQYRDSFKDKIKKEVMESSAAKQQKLDAFAKRQAEIKSTKVQQVANDTISKYAMEFKTIVTAGVLSITAGEHNYEIDEIPVIVGNYSDTVLAKVNTVTDDQDITVPASTLIMKYLAKSMFDSYSLTRQAYIRKHKSGFGVFSESGKLLGHHKTKQEAVQQLRAIEYHKRHRE